MSEFFTLIYNGQDVWLNDIPFNYIDDAGNKWIISDIDGWWGLPDVEADEDTRPYTQDGSYFTTGRYPSRNITVSGKIVPAYNSEFGYDGAVIARNLLNTRLNMVRSLGLFRVNENPDKLAVVQLIGRPLTKFDKPNNVLSFNFQLKASDPRKYSVDELNVSSALSGVNSGRAYKKTFTYTYANLSTGDDFIVENAGSYNTGGTFTIRGPVTNPYIEHVNSGNILRLNTTLGISDKITLDLYDRKIILNETASRKNILDTRSRWFLIESGTNTLRYRGNQQVPANPGSAEVVNEALNPVPLVIGGWASEQFGGAGNDYVVSLDNTMARRVQMSSIAVSGAPSSTYFASSTTMGALRGIGSISGVLSCVSSQDYTFSIWAMADTAGFNSAQIGADFYDSSMTFISTSLETQTITSPSGTWTRLSTAFTSPLNAVYISLRASVSSNVLPGQLGVIVRFNDAMLTKSLNLYEYFDGSYSSAFWSGAPNQSTSIQAAVPAVPQSVVEFTYRSAWIE